jgi:hypothetical protein
MQLQHIQSKIFENRKQRIMLDFDLAELYQVETRALNQAVKRNSKRFPADFMFQLTEKEWQVLISQFVISKEEKRLGMSSQTVMTSDSKRPKTELPCTFTEQALATQGEILNSNKKRTGYKA